MAVRQKVRCVRCVSETGRAGFSNVAINCNAVSPLRCGCGLAGGRTNEQTDGGKMPGGKVRRFYDVDFSVYYESFAREPVDTLISALID